VKRTKVQN